MNILAIAQWWNDNRNYILEDNSNNYTCLVFVSIGVFLGVLGECFPSYIPLDVQMEESQAQ